MNDRRYAHDPALFIDRLAADELDDDSRRALFAWLDREPARWRRCALALLEAREMEGAIEEWLGETAAGAAPPVGRKQPVALPRESRLDGGRRVAVREQRPGRSAMLAIAASVALAFGLGMAADRRIVALRDANAPPQAVAQASPTADAVSRGELPHSGKIGVNDSRQADVSGDGEETGDGGELPQPFAPVASAHSSAADQQLIPAYVKSQLERRGYRVDSRREFVSVSLPGGRRALVPLEEWEFRYVGKRAY